MTQSNKDLYGTDKVIPIPKAITEQRISLLKRRLEELMMVHWTNQDTRLIKRVSKAIIFWKEMSE